VPQLLGDAENTLLVSKGTQNGRYVTTVICNIHMHAVTLLYKGTPYSITKSRVPELIPVPGSQPAGDVNHKPGSRLPLLSARPAVTPTTLKRAATSFAAW